MRHLSARQSPIANARVFENAGSNGAHSYRWVAVNEQLAHCAVICLPSTVALQLPKLNVFPTIVPAPADSQSRHYIEVHLAST